MPLTAIREFLRHESASGLILVAAAILALILDNSPLAWLYDSLLATPMAVQIGQFEIHKPLLLWINDGLMAVFFFLVGLEIKREVLEGELSSRAQIALPGMAAVGGMALPAMIYAAINWGDDVALRGWAIPAATDIAFALGILSLVGARVPIALKIFLLALAILDDLGAIVIIALFYTADLSTEALALSGICLVALVVINRLGVMRVAPYILIGAVMWVCVLKSGVHATLAGVALAMAIPLRARGRAGVAPLRGLEHMLHPWVAYLVLPAFAFANAGVSLSGLSFASLLAPVPLGIAAGLFFGKQIGILGFVRAAVWLGLCRLPTGVTWLQLYGVSLLAGIGFTMSLFIGTLAFEDPAFATDVRLGVLGGSTCAGVLGYLVLRFATRPGLAGKLAEANAVREAGANPH